MLKLLTFLLLASCYLATSMVDGQELDYPGEQWKTVKPAEVRMDATKLAKARDYALTGGGSGCIARHGRIVMRWGDQTRRYDLKSTSKSIGVTALGLAIQDGKIELSDKAIQHHPSLGIPPDTNRKAWLEEITVLHLATQTAGFAKPGGYEPLLFRPGTKWHYSDGGPNWLAECITLSYRQDIEDLMFQRVLSPIGITKDDLRWRKHAYRPDTLEGISRREFGSGVHANVDAMARIGYLYLRRGKWRKRQLVPAEFVDQARATVDKVVGLEEHSDQHGNASDHYGLLWWNNADGAIAGVPPTTYWSWGLYDSLIVVFPELDVVVARAGKSWNREGWNAHYGVLEPFFRPIVESVNDIKADTGRQNLERSKRPRATPGAPHPKSRVITDIQWAPIPKIQRAARGSDNWPLTWGDDGHLYTAYGDGTGFKPSVPKKLSLGFARVEGGPETFVGKNIRSATGETEGNGAKGIKASGMLMVEGTLYMWARNAGNSTLAWSNDRGQSWNWSDWKFESSFGCPTFLNFGRNYDGARDDFVYIYSADSDSAYQPADRMVMARVPKAKIRRRSAYEFFVGLEAGGKPEWTTDLAKRGAVFIHVRQCYRTGISYNPALQRYLWCQVLPGSEDPRGPRFQGGFGIYDAPEPWGPWTTVFFTTEWDVGPGETCSLPPKWMSPDGRTVHLVFSGDDCFSVRQAMLAVDGKTSR